MKPRNIRGQGIANNRNLKDYYHKFDVHDSVHSEKTREITKKMPNID